VEDLMQFMRLAKTEVDEQQRFEGMQFVITGSLQHFSNRKELQELIEKQGGKAASAVSAKTTYLINNNVQSTSSKNKKANELGIPIISEETFLEMVNGN
jgi:DNA ligase (NAD+)